MQIILPDTIIKKGAYESAPFVVPAEECKKFMLRMERRNWPVATDKKHILHCRVWISYNGGRKFKFLMGFQANGHDDPECSAWCGIKPQYKTNERVIKITIESDFDIETRMVAEFW